MKNVEQSFENHLFVEPKFPLRMYKKIKSLGKELVNLSSQISKKNLNKASNKDLIKLFQEFYNKHFLFDPFFRFSFPGGKIFERRVKYILKYYLTKRNEIDKYDKYSESLVIAYEKPELTREKEEFAKIILTIKESKELREALVKNNFKKIRKYLTKYINDFSFLTFSAGQGKKQTPEEVIKEIKSNIKKTKAELLTSINWYDKQKIECKKLLQKLKIPHGFNNLVYLMQRYIFLRLFVKESVEKSYYLIYNLLSEVGKRIGVAKYEDVIYLLPEEIIKYLESNKKADKEIIPGRKNKFAISRDNNKITFYSGEEVEKLKNKTEKVEIKEKIEIKGSIANKGIAKGKAAVVLYSADVNKVNEGDILVAPMTTPEFVSAMKKASAIVTDEGGITCHAAIISRELGIPCVIGTKIATKVLRDGDEVEVDANKGIVKKLG